MRWQAPFAARVVRGAERNGAVRSENGVLTLTDRGRHLAESAMAR